MPRKPIDEVHVRVGVPEDIDQIMIMAEMVCKENGIFEPNMHKIFADIWPALHQEQGLVGVIGEREEGLEGFVLLRIGTMWYADTPILEEKTVFVHPKFRKSSGGRARKMCRFSKQVADELGISLLIGVLSNSRTNGKMRLYESEFGAPAGGFFLYKARTGGWSEQAPLAAE
jgi:hypothetical protein